MHEFNSLLKERANKKQPKTGGHAKNRPQQDLTLYRHPSKLVVLRRTDTRWKERMFASAKELDRPGAFPYKMQLHAFHAGRVSFERHVAKQVDGIMS